MQNLKKIIVLLLSLCFIFVSCGGGAGGGDSTPPANLTDVDVNVTKTSVTFTWTNPSDSDYKSMVILRGENIDEVQSPTHTYTKGLLLPGTQYTFTFKSKDMSGNLSTGFSKTITTQDATAPTNLSDQTLTSRVTENSVTFTWTNPSDSDYKSMEIYQGTNKIEEVPKTSTTYTVNRLTPGNEYSFILKSKDTADNISSGYTKAIKTAPANPTEVDLVASSVTTNSVTLSWTRPTTATYAKMKIYQVGTDGTLTLKATVNKASGSNTTETYTLTGLTAGTQYNFKLKSTDSDGNESSGVSPSQSNITTFANLSMNQSVVVLGLVSSGTGQNNTATLSTTFTPSSWNSSNTSVVTVNNGTITAQSAGVAKITATAGTSSAETTVLVLNTSDSFSFVNPTNLMQIPSGDFAGYRTEIYEDEPGRGQVAYKISSGKIDVIGYDGQQTDSWHSSTKSNAGWSYKINDTPVNLTTSEGSSYGSATAGNLSLTVVPVIVKKGSINNGIPYVLLVHALTNTGNTALSVQKFGAGADIDVAENNNPVYVTNTENNQGIPFRSGVLSYDTASKLVFMLNWRPDAGSNWFPAAAISPADTLWIGAPTEVMNNIYENQSVSITNSSTDSAVAYSWKNISLNSGETKLFTVRVSLTEDKRGSLEAIVW